MKFNCTEDKLRELLESASLSDNNSTFKDASTAISSDIIDKQLDLSEYVENLGFALTSPKLELRIAATKLLSETIFALPHDFLNATQINFITTFYCDRLKDQHSVVPAVLKGILSIIRMQQLSNGLSTQVLQNIFQNVVCQSQVREDRLIIFQILQQLAENHTKEMLAMGSDFIYGVINAIDGERDPRLLVYIFEFLPNFIHTYPLGHLVEEMFEVCACYFPVDFNPSQNDQISRDLLADKLSDCLAGTKEFAEYCIPLLLEKLESDLNVAKLDSLSLLTKCAQNYDAQTIETHFSTIWTTLKMELIPGTNSDILPMALHTLQKLIESLSCDSQTISNAMTIIFQTILNPLTNIDTRFFASSTNVAYTCARASAVSSTIITNKLLPIFLSQFPTENMFDDKFIIQRKTLLNLIIELIEICVDKNCLSTIESSHLATMENEIIQCFTAHECLIDFSLNLSAKVCVTISAVNRQLIYTIIVQRLLNGSGNNYENIIKLYAIAYTNEVMNNIIMKLIEFNCETINSIEIINNIFAAICSCTTVTLLSDVILTFLIETIFSNNTKISNQIPRIALNHLMKLIKNDLNSSQIQELHTKYDIINKSFKLIHSINICQSSDDAMQQITDILQTIIIELNLNEQKRIVECYLPNINVQTNETDIFLLAGIIGHVNELIVIPNYHTIISQLIELSIYNYDVIKVKICNELLCSLFNKCDDIQIIDECIDKLNEIIDTDDKPSAFITLSWITKGLLVKGHAKSIPLIYKLIDLLDHNEKGNNAAIAFQNISIDLPMIHMPIVKILYKQKLFQIMLNKLTLRLQEFSNNHMIAMAYVMEQVSHHVLKINIEKVGPILFKCIKSNVSTLLLISLNIMKQFFDEQNEYFQNHFQHIIGSFINLCTFKESMKIRIAALQCLQIICTKYPTIELLSYKLDIIHGLENVLDDKKRLVRNEAVKTRNLWFLVGNAK